jgi:SAM-dependent methyltransferase
MEKNLEQFYESWSEKSDQGIKEDIQSATRKANKIIEGITYLKENEIKIKSLIDFGCGYGTILSIFAKHFQTDFSLGFDFSTEAVKYANHHYPGNNNQYFKTPSLDVHENVDLIKSKIGNQKVDCILLTDLLEHIPNCIELIKELSKITKYFIIKLPIESSVFDNLILNKEYPSSIHSNGHLREFTVNTVHYFIRELGLTPLYEATYIYNINDTFPKQDKWNSFRHKIRHHILKYFKRLSSIILPKRLFLRLIGGGGYYCISTFNQDHILNP